MIHNVLAYLRREFRGVRVYIRATISGHPNCKHAQGPYSDALYEPGPAWHNWCAHGFERQPIHSARSHDETVGMQVSDLPHDDLSRCNVLFMASCMTLTRASPLHLTGSVALMYMLHA